ncbi:MAG: hypothetical protein OXF02_01260 [Simkaniaceae bacterium]|nr:hypothetical protein [Simkaniaceae bacterium]
MIPQPERAQRVFTEGQKARVADYRFDEFDGESFPKCARKGNLRKSTLIDWVTERDSQEGTPDTTEWSGSSPEATASDRMEEPLKLRKGFSWRNPYTMRDFYSSHREDEKLRALSAKSSRTHNAAILSKCKTPTERALHQNISSARVDTQCLGSSHRGRKC